MKQLTETFIIINTLNEKEQIFQDYVSFNKNQLIQKCEELNKQFNKSLNIDEDFTSLIVLNLSEAILLFKENIENDVLINIEQLLQTVVVNENHPIKPKQSQDNIAIKGDGTTRYGTRIYKYFLDKGVDMGKLSAKDFKPKLYYSIEDNTVVYCPYLSEGLEEKTLKKIK